MQKQRLTHQSVRKCRSPEGAAPVGQRRPRTAHKQRIAGEKRGRITPAIAKDDVVNQTQQGSAECSDCMQTSTKTNQMLTNKIVFKNGLLLETHFLCWQRN